jgi:predicted protein tyrosine phosphatase
MGYSNHIDAVLCCAREVPLFPTKPGHHLRIDDGVTIALKLAYEFLDEHLAAGQLVLVYCGPGASRSAAVLCGYLALKSAAEPHTVLKSIQRLRPEVDPSRSTLQSVERYVRGDG